MILFLLFEFAFGGVLLAADLLSKHFVMPYLETHGATTLIPKVLTFTPEYNTGAGFSFLSGHTAALIAITSVGLAIILGFLVWGHLKLDVGNKRNRFLLAVLVMMFAGGLGNLIDRIAFGYVRDFIDYTVVYTLFKKSFAVCNVADIWLTIGMILLLVYVIFFWKEDNLKSNVPQEKDNSNVRTALYLMDKAEARLPSKVAEEDEQTQESAEQSSSVSGEDARKDDSEA